VPAARGWRADHSASRRHGRHAAAALRMNIHKHTYNKRLCTTVRTPSRSGCIGAAVRPVVTWRIVLALLLKSELSKSAYGMLSVCGAAQDDPRGRHAAGMLALVVFLICSAAFSSALCRAINFVLQRHGEPAQFLSFSGRLSEAFEPPCQRNRPMCDWHGLQQGSSSSVCSGLTCIFCMVKND